MYTSDGEKHRRGLEFWKYCFETGSETNNIHFLNRIQNKTTFFSNTTSETDGLDDYIKLILFSTSFSSRKSRT